jgi:hypothetical protein
VGSSSVVAVAGSVSTPADGSEGPTDGSEGSAEGPADAVSPYDISQRLEVLEVHIIMVITC